MIYNGARKIVDKEIKKNCCNVGGGEKNIRQRDHLDKSKSYSKVLWGTK